MLRLTKYLDEDNTQFRIVMKCTSCNLKYVLSSFPGEPWWVCSEHRTLPKLKYESFFNKIFRSLQVMEARNCSITGFVVYKGTKQY